jgi:hypothetical protein
MAVHQHFNLVRIEVESGRVGFRPSDLLLKSIALAQICGISLARFLRYSLDDSSGSKMQTINPSSFAFFR